jgi:hypothetical protein
MTSAPDDWHAFLADVVVGSHTDRNAGVFAAANLQMASAVSLLPEVSQSDDIIGTVTDSRTSLLAGAHVGVQAAGRMGAATHRIRGQLTAALPALTVRDSGPTPPGITDAEPTVPGASLPNATLGEATTTASVTQSVTTSDITATIPIGAIALTDVTEGPTRLTPFTMLTIETGRWNASAALLRRPDGRLSTGGEIVRQIGPAFLRYGLAAGGHMLPWLFDVTYPGFRPSRLLRASERLTHRGDRFRSVHTGTAGLQLGDWYAATSITADTETPESPGVSLQISREIRPLGWSVAMTGMLGGPTEISGATIGLQGP